MSLSRLSLDPSESGRSEWRSFALPFPLAMVAPLRLTAAAAEARSTLPGLHNVGEGQCVRARAAGRGCGAVVVEGQGWRATGDGDRFTHVERQSRCSAGFEDATRW